jgi:hypothetical protein
MKYHAKISFSAKHPNDSYIYNIFDTWEDAFKYLNDRIQETEYTEAIIFTDKEHTITSLRTIK